MQKLSMKQFIRAATIEPNFDKYPQDRKNENLITFDYFGDGEQSMNCPIREFSCTHITGVEVFSRGEDAAEHTHTTVDMINMKPVLRKWKATVEIHQVVEMV